MTTTVTKTIKSADGDYTSLSAWESANQADITLATGSDTIQQAECYNFASADTLTLSGWTTAAGQYIRIFTPQAQRHAGTIASGFRLTQNGSDGAIRLAEEFVRIEGLVVLITDVGDNGIGDVGIPNAAGDIRISHCVVASTLSPVSTQTGRGLNFSSLAATPVLKAWNNIIYDFGNGGSSTGFGISLISSSAVAYLYNNTVHSCRFGIVTGSANHLLKNNLCDSNSAGDYTGTVSASSVTNLASDTTSPNNDLDSQDPAYVDEAGDDFHLAAGDAVDVGTDLSADANLPFDDDIDGETRSGAWDVGADEIVAAGGGGLAIPIAMYHLRHHLGA